LGLKTVTITEIENVMGETEFIIALTEHRYLGSVFVPYLIEKKEQFYTVKTLVKLRDLNRSEYTFHPYEKELVKIIEKYSDENLTKKFSRAENVSEFYATLKKGYFEKHVTPYIEKCMFQVASVLMLSPVRLLNKEVKYANLYDEDEIKVQPLFARPVFYFERTDTETHYHLKVILDDKEIPLQNRNIKIITNEPCLMLYRGGLVVFEKLNAKKLIPFFEKEVVTVPHSIEEKYYNGFVLNTVRDFEVQAKGFRILEEDVNKTAVLGIEKNLKYEPGLVLYFRYGDEQFLPNSNREIAVNLRKENNEYVFKKVRRDFDWEKNVLSFLGKLRLTEDNGYFSPEGLSMLEKENALWF
jgi:hypothetical protein